MSLRAPGCNDSGPEFREDVVDALSLTHISVPSTLYSSGPPDFQEQYSLPEVYGWHLQHYTVHLPTNWCDDECGKTVLLRQLAHPLTRPDPM